MGLISIQPTNWDAKIKISAEPGFELGAAGWEARMLPLCYAAHKLMTYCKLRMQKIDFFPQAWRIKLVLPQPTHLSILLKKIYSVAPPQGT